MPKAYVWDMSCKNQDTRTQWRSHWGCKGGRVPPLTAKKLPKIGKNLEKIRKNREKRGEIGKKRQKSGRFFFFFTLPLLTDRAGYATARSARTHQFSRPTNLVKTSVVHVCVLTDTLYIPQMCALWQLINIFIFFAKYQHDQGPMLLLLFKTHKWLLTLVTWSTSVC